VPESPIKTPSRVDFVGATLLSGGLICLLVALTEGENWGWTSGRTLTLGALALAFFVAWVLAELRVPEPMVDMRMMAMRQVLFTNLTALVAGFAMFGTFVLVPNFVETPHDLPLRVQRLVDYGFDASATKAGLYLLPSSITLLFAGPIAGLLGRRWGSKWPLAIGLVLVATSAASLAMFHDEPWQLLLAMAIIGVGIGFAFASMANLIVESVDVTQTGVATGMNTIVRSIGGAIGSQVSAGIVTATLAANGLPTERGFTIAFASCAVALAVAFVVALRIPAPVRVGVRRKQMAQAA
jgi:MFS family permease